MKKLIAVPVIVLLLTVAVVAAALGSATAGATPVQKAAVIKIGHIVDKTGAEAQVGKYFDTGFNLAVATYGKIAGKEIQVISADALGTPAGAVDAARKLVMSDHVVAIFGPTQAAQKVAVANYIKRVKIPLILYNPSPVGLVKNNPYVVGIGGSMAQDPTVMGNYMRTNLKWSTVDALFREGSDAQQMEDPALTYFKKHGGTVTQATYIPDGTSDYGGYFSTLKPADGIIAWATGSGAFAFWSTYKFSGVASRMKVASVFVNGMCDGFVVNNLPAAVQAAVSQTPGPGMYAPDSNTPQNAAFRKVVSASLGYVPDGISASWQGYTCFKRALQKTGGSTNTAKLIKALTSGKVVGPEGPVMFAKGSHIANRTVYIEKVDPIPGVSGKYQYVTVKTYANVPISGLK